MEAGSTQMGETMGSVSLVNMPVNGRSYTDLLALQPGVTPASSKQPNAVVMSGWARAAPSGDLNPGDVFRERAAGDRQWFRSQRQFRSRGL